MQVFKGSPRAPVQGKSSSMASNTASLIDWYIAPLSTARSRLAITEWAEALKLQTTLIAWQLLVFI